MSPGISVPALPSASPTGAQFPSAANTDADKPAINPTAIVYFENHIRIFLLYSVEVSPFAKVRDHRHRSGRQPLGADVGWARTPSPCSPLRFAEPGRPGTRPLLLPRR